MRICLVTPAPPGSSSGNRVTALRWAGLLRELGHRVTVAQRYTGQRSDLLVALHARKSYASVARFRREHPEAPIVVALTGTDVYEDLGRSKEARLALRLATRLVALQSEASRELPRGLRAKVRVIHQSARRPRGTFRPRRDVFDVCVLAHLREVKDPFRVAAAVRLLPGESRIAIRHLGAALEAGMAAKARQEERKSPRYRWLGELPRGRALKTLARSRLMVITSRLEGGANAVSEALTCSVPVLSSRIPGSIGLLGRSYPGYFPLGDTRTLARLMSRAETDPRFYRRLKAACAKRRTLVSRREERRRWAALLAEVTRAEVGPAIRTNV